MNVQRMRLYAEGGDREAAERRESLARYRATAGRRTMTKADLRRHASIRRRLVDSDHFVALPAEMFADLMRDD